LAGTTESTRLLDAPIGMAGAGVVVVIMSDGSYVSANVTVSVGATQINVSPPLASASWVLSTATLGTQKFRVVSISEGDDGTYAISAVAYDTDKP